MRVYQRERRARFVEGYEEAQRDSLAAQKERAERGFREGRFTRWEKVKIDNGL